MLTIIASIFAAGLAPAVAQTPALVVSAAVQRPIVGGYRSVDVADEAVQAAAYFAASSVDGELAEVTSAERQVVQGTNFRLNFSTTDGRVYAAIVFRALDGSYRVTTIDEVGDQHGEASEDEAPASGE